MPQSKRLSAAEALTIQLTALAYGIPLNWFLLEKVSWSDPWSRAVLMTFIFFGVGIVHKYVFRRLFNRVSHTNAQTDRN